MEDDVEVSGGGRHQEEEEVEVGVGEEAVLVDCVEQGSFPRHGHLVRLPHIPDQMMIMMMMMMMILFASLTYFELSSDGAICLYADLPNIISSDRLLPGVIAL